MGRQGFVALWIRSKVIAEKRMVASGRSEPVALIRADRLFHPWKASVGRFELVFPLYTQSQWTVIHCFESLHTG
jgi:hypothetical protein